MQDKASSGASGQSWMSKLGDDRGARGSRPTEAKGDAGYPAVAAKAAPPTAEQSRPKTDWREALSDNRGGMRGGRGSSGPSGGASTSQSKKDERSAGDWWDHDDRSGSGSSGATAAQATPSGPASGSAGGAQRMLGIAMRSAGGDMRANGTGTSRASATNGAHGTPAPKTDSNDAKSDVKAKLKSFLLSKPGQVEQRKRTLRVCVQQGRDILGEGVTLESDVVEDAIREVDAELTSEATASQADASPETEGQDDWWSKNKKWEEDDGKWRTDGQWESQDGDAWRSDAGWKGNDQRWEGGDKWWESGHQDNGDQKWAEQGATEQGKQEDTKEGSSWASAGADALDSNAASEDEMINNLLKYLETAKDPVKAKAVLRNYGSGVSSRVAEAAIAMYEGKDRNSALGAAIYQ
mmetsp:Transcript_60115/g.113363  ORF Transcript_60115/g.113363 Transcript_60115/m.113363 type:complete len:408 (-) Transcript_60115:124-1347(-)